MINYIVRLIVCAAIVWLIPQYTNEIHVASFQDAFIVALVMSILNNFVKPILQIVSLPITFLTLGLFTLVITVGIVYLCAYLVEGFRVDGFLAPLIFSLLLSAANGIVGLFQKK